MSTVSQIRSAWDTNIFQNAAITAITDKIYTHRKDTESLTRSQDELLRYNREHNWIEYIVERIPSGGMIGQRRYEYTVEVTIYRGLDPDSTNYTATIDAMDTLTGLVVTELGITWAGTVDRWLDVDDTPTKNEIEISGNRVLSVSQTFTAEKYI